LLNVPQELLFLYILLGLGIIGKNQSITIAVLFLLVLRVSGLGNKSFPVVEKYAMDFGIIAITVAVLVPIANGNIRLQDLFQSFTSSYGIIALIAGIIVALLGAYGLDLLNSSPQITISLVIGTILAVVFLKGLPVGPLIASGIAMVIIKLYEVFKTFVS